jgi:hypothetical protein
MLVCGCVVDCEQLQAMLDSPAVQRQNQEESSGAPALLLVVFQEATWRSGDDGRTVAERLQVRF